MTAFLDRIGNQRKIPKWLPFKNYKSESLNFLMCIYGGHMCICIPNIKFLCLTLCQGEVCTDDDDDANINDARRTKHGCIRLFG